MTDSVLTNYFTAMLVLTQPLITLITPERTAGTMTMALPFRQKATVKMLQQTQPLCKPENTGLTNHVTSEIKFHFP